MMHLDTSLQRMRWLVFAALLLLVAGLLGRIGGLGRLDYLLADAVRSFDPPAARGDIVVIAIDDASLKQLGPLPWPQATYTRLLDTLAEAQPRVVGIATPWNRRYLSTLADERTLAASVARTGNMVLPVVMSGSRGRLPMALPPTSQLADAAEALGHVHTPIDSDGIARAVYLSEGSREHPWDHLALAMYKLGAGEAAAARGGSGSDRSQVLPDDEDVVDLDWVNNDRLLVPFPKKPVRHVSFVDVVAGIVPLDELRNKYVLVGATAPGVGNAFVTPASARGVLTPEVDLVAAVLQALLDQHYVHPAIPRASAVANMLPALAAAVVVAALPTTLALLALAGIGLLVIAGAALLPMVAHVQVYPVAGLAALALAYPLWASLRMFLALRSLSAEVTDMPASVFPANMLAPAGSDMIERHIGRLHDAIDQLRTAQRLVNDSLDSVPDVTLIADARGAIQIANAPAQRYLRRGGMPDYVGLNLREVAARLLPPEVLTHVNATFGASADTPGSIEFTAPNGRGFLLRVLPRRSPDGTPAGWIVSLVDIHTVREAQKQRDDALRFISHDMRSPQSSILSLIELRAQGAKETQDVDRLLERIGRYARTALDISEDFIQLARAESGSYSFHQEDLYMLLGEAADLLWAKARERGIRIELPQEPPEAHCMVDRSLMTRAFMNLLDNAVKFSPDGTTIRCDVTPAGDTGSHWQVSVRDEGPGIPVSEIEVVFEKFRRSSGDTHSRVEGAGLGLAFVKSVVTAHGGTISAINSPEQGAEFRICLPCAQIRGAQAPDH